MKPKNYFSVFAKMPAEAKVFTLQRALNCPPDEAKTIIEKLENELKYQETLLSLAHRKSHITEQETTLIDKIKTVRLKDKRKREGKKGRLIRNKYYYEIDRLRNEGIGWRKISEYIRIYHHKRISHVTIRNAYLKIKKQMEQSDEDR